MSKRGKLIVMRGKRSLDINAARERYAGLTTVTASNNLVAALRMFADERGNFVMRTRNGLNINQNTFKSMFYRGYIEYSEKDGGFKFTAVGKAHAAKFAETDITNEKPAKQFGSYLRVIPALSGKFKSPQKTKLKTKMAGGAA